MSKADNVYVTEYIANTWVILWFSHFQNINDSIVYKMILSKIRSNK